MPEGKKKKEHLRYKSRQEQNKIGKTKIRKIPGLILRNTVLTTPGGGYDGGNHATSTPRLWARILVTTQKEQA